MGTYKMCLCFTRKFRTTYAEPPADVRKLFESVAGGATHMTAEQLRQFLVEHQGEVGATAADAEKIVDYVRNCRHHHHLGRLSRPGLTVEDFHYYLFSVDLNGPVNTQVHQDMSAPMSHYFIYTGHNSYLTGNQLSSESSDVPIIDALKRGVRVIELDLWPNDAKDNIDVLHGRTLTSPVELIRCFKSIKEHAFVASSYPVIITLEDHLTPNLQAKVGEMLTQTFEGLLFTSEAESVPEFPSPESLKNRVIVSTKPPKEYIKSKPTIDVRDESQKEKVTKEENAWGNEVPDIKTELLVTSQKTTSDDQDNQTLQEEDVDEVSVKPLENKPPEYKHLITIKAKTRSKNGLKETLKVEPGTVHRISLNEQKIEEAAQLHGADLVRFTQKNLLRVFPKATRFDSSNYNPFIGWIHGAHMVAFNMQSHGRSLWLMHGMFKANGGCGYVKKPDFLMNVGAHNEVFNPMATLAVKKTLKVKVYTGDGWWLDFKQTHFDRYSPPDFYTRVGIAGVPADSQMKKTKTVEDDWVPTWNEEFIFPLTVPELALLRIEVHEYDRSGKDDFGGQTVLPISELKTGIRSVPLYNQEGEQFENVKLLMGFEWLM